MALKISNAAAKAAADAVVSGQPVQVTSFTYTQPES